MESTLECIAPLGCNLVNIAGETFTMHLVDFDMYFEVDLINGLTWRFGYK